MRRRWRTPAEPRFTRRLKRPASRLGSPSGSIAGLFDGRPPERFVTAFFGLLELNEHRLRYTSAGHGPTWFYSRASNNLAELEVHGYPLALEADESFDVAGTTQFAPGDFVVIVTDGFFEWLDTHGECFGTQRLCAQLLRDRDRSAAEIIGGLRDTLLSFANGSPQGDDLTAVVIKRVS